jgi:hypothetical protein
MIGAIEILIIAVIFGVIYGRDAIDRTWKKNPNEGVVESFTDDVKEYYHEDPKTAFQTNCTCIKYHYLSCNFGVLGTN